MIQTLQLTAEKECLALIADITYKNEASWFGEAERPLKLSLLLPKHKEGHVKMPLLLWLCGGNFAQVDHNIWLPQMMPYARAGYVVASAEYRTVNEAPFPAALVDVKAAIRYLRAHSDRYCIDPAHVFIMGESAGGALAVFAGLTGVGSGAPGEETGHADACAEVPRAANESLDQGDCLEYSSAVTGVIDLYGPVDFARDFEDMKGNPVKHGAYLQRAAAFPGEAREQQYAHFALDHVSKDAPPFLIFHGTADEKVAPAHSEMLCEALTAHGVPADLYLVEGAAHGADVFYQEEITEIVLSFLDRYSRT